MNDRPQTPAAALRRIGPALALTRAGMLVERALRAFWPFGSFLAVLVAAFAFGVQDALPLVWVQAGAALGLLVSVGLLLWGARRFHWPKRAEALARLDATLPGRPIAALHDTMALGGQDAGARALWAVHLTRMAARLTGARAVPPRPDLAPRDPFALRLTALTALAVALIFGAPARLAEVADLPGAIGPAEAAIGPTWEGWAEPPRYTGKPGLYLNALDAGALDLPEGTRLVFRFYGAAGQVGLTETVTDPAAPAPPAAADGITIQKQELVALRSGLLEITGPGGRRFDLTILPDAAPSVELLSAATRRADGKLSQPFRATDDYGVTAGRALITLDLPQVDRRYGLTTRPDDRAPLIYDLPLPISGNRADFTEALVEDAAKHPWANLPVKLTLTVEDGRAQTGATAPLSLELPGRRFFDPMAAALIEARRDLLWSLDNGSRTSQILKAISNRPAGYSDGQKVYLLLRAAIRRLDTALTPGPLDAATRDDLAEALWAMAEMLEDGGLADALAAMQQAQERLSEAIRNGASPDEIAKLMDELKRATDEYLRQLAEQSSKEEGPQFGQQQPGQNITGAQIQQMMDEIQRLMEEGRMAEAQELLDQLARMMENMKVTQGQGGEGDIPGGKAMRDLGETLRNQQELSDDAFRELQDSFERGQQGQSQPQPGQPGQGQGQSNDDQGQGQPNGEAQDQGTPGDGRSLAQRQRDLRTELGRQHGLLPRTGNEAGEDARRALDQAGRAMDEAEQALREGDNGTAIDRQADAIQALREGMRALGEALADQQGGGQQGDQGERYGAAEGQTGRELPRDPLGRALGNGGQVGTDESLLQGQDVYRRARDLLDEIRRRSGERLRPELELDYLRRLLDQF
ncbi:TIGR02302 family protein [Phaeovulum sp.]|uniref:TIGR02302 family protein n=1 Tax=Phaeovulum sp. TaxID=2934796 RepID=UPI0039E68F5B